VANNFSLRHNPLGLEHPYEQYPWERSPRFPAAGEMVALGVATTPAGNAERVTVKWMVKDNAKEGTAEGTWLADDGDYSYWKIQLPAFSARDQVTYQLFASKGNEIVCSETYSFDVLEWVESGDVVTYHANPSSIALSCSSKYPSINSTLHIDLSNQHRLRFHLELGKKEELGSDFHPELDTKPEEAAKSPINLRVIEDNEECIVFDGCDLKLIIYRHPCRLEIRREDGSPILIEREPTKWSLGVRGEAKEVRQVFYCEPIEAFYGFGERFNSLNQRGNAVDVRVYEQYKNQDLRTYLPVPFFTSSEGYGIYFDTSRYISFDLGASDTACWSFQAELDSNESLEYEMCVDDDPKAILYTYACLTGFPALPPSWAFGLWMSSNEWNNQATILDQLKHAKDLNIPATVLVIEAWSDEATFYIWNDAQYNPKPSNQYFNYSDFTFPKQGKWPDPKGMIRELHENGLHILLWQIPVCKHSERGHHQSMLDQEHMIENGYCVHDQFGMPYQVKPPWFEGSLVLDFTNKAASDWWMSKRAYLLDELDIDGFKTDGGEHLWGRSLRFADGRRGDEIWNLYPNLYVKAYHELLKDKKAEEGITFSRSGFTGAQQYPCHWAGDENSTWEAYRASIMAGLNVGLSGIPFWGWDIAGFSGPIPSTELFLRATAMAAFCPIMQFHSEYNHHFKPSNDRTPWNIEQRAGDKDVVPVFRKYANLRMNLLPYIYSQARLSSETGLPIMRALPLEFRHDRECDNYPYQYLFGSSLLVAPVISENANSQKIYLPLGDWYDFWTHQIYKGPLLIDYPTPKESIPVFVRAGTVLPLNLNETYSLGESVGNATDQYRNFTLMFYPQDEVYFTREWFDLVSRQQYRVEYVREIDTSIRIEVPPIPHDTTLVFVKSIWTSLLLDDKSLSISQDIKELRDSSSATGYVDNVRRLTYLKLPQGNSSRTIRLGL